MNMTFFFFFNTLVSKKPCITSLRLHNMQHMQQLHYRQDNAVWLDKYNI